mmetsp:Transcript_20166/g.28966  ORF Transcript_20166/g.28966 Transcript_20166/m.28966 type:complete len:212 (-) Transcript_20166:701-1336(-)
MNVLHTHLNPGTKNSSAALGNRLGLRVLLWVAFHFIHASKRYTRRGVSELLPYPKLLQKHSTNVTVFRSLYERGSHYIQHAIPRRVIGNMQGAVWHHSNKEVTHVYSHIIVTHKSRNLLYTAYDRCNYTDTTRIIQPPFADIRALATINLNKRIYVRMRSHISILVMNIAKYTTKAHSCHDKIADPHTARQMNEVVAPVFPILRITGGLST